MSLGLLSGHVLFFKPHKNCEVILNLLSRQSYREAVLLSLLLAELGLT